MVTSFSFLRRKKEDGDNVRVLDLAAGLVFVVAVVVAVMLVRDDFFVRKLIPTDFSVLEVLRDVVLLVLVVAVVGDGAASGASEAVESPVVVLFDNRGSLNGRKEDRNVCMCVIFVIVIW